MAYKFNRLELAGSLGDLGTLLPIAVGMIMINGLNPVGIFISVGLLYLLAGIYFQVPVSVQPMKVIGAYAIATAMTSSQIMASGALMGVILILIGATNIITVIARYIPKPVVRGVQLSTGILLMTEGIKFMIGSSNFQMMHQLSEPFLKVQHLGIVPVGVLIGGIGAVVTMFFISSKRFPAGLIIIITGITIGAVFGTHKGFDSLHFGLYLPEFLPFDFPTNIDFVFALFALALPQLPMTLGNAVVANTDLSYKYFGADSKKVTNRSVTLSMGLANIVCFCLGGMPLCHGAGGLAAHYRFGARTAGSNIIIGVLFIALATTFGTGLLTLIYLIPMAILGVLLFFAGGQLALTLLDIKERKDLFVTFAILVITLSSNLGVGFMAGIVLAYMLKTRFFTV